MKYEKYRYLYPPRPEHKIPRGDLEKYDNGEYFAQPKYNGSCTVVFTNGKELHVYNRHQEPLSGVSPDIEFKKLAQTGNWFVFTGEYLNKGKFGENGEKEKDKFVLWDCIVWDGKYLFGETLESRLTLLEKIHPCKRARVTSAGDLELYKHLCCTELKGIYKTPTYTDGFTELYDEIVKTDLYEGLVLKKRHSKLGFGYNKINNTDWQLKCRKETKNYKF